MPKWAWVSYSVKEGSGQNSSGPSFHYRSSPVPNGQGLSPLGKCLPYNKKIEEAHHKHEYRGQHGQGDNELLSASLPQPQPMLITAWVMGRRAECTQSSGSPLLHTETCLHIQNETERINSENIWTIYSNTLWIVLEAGGQRAVVENGQWIDSGGWVVIFFCHELPKWLWFTEGPIDN